ncbi:low molecular weight protein-tyrosine-phosphatase [Paraburkholderia aspalathi]|uniref:low molecular weight protein-tyrosine-phosphatase n=1 Tax=Paraburkholderia aspalathi TaxID=1324617 RepID=UPI0038BB1529
MIDNILVICEGNICRSPMAKGFLAKELPQARISSAGLNALVGSKADPTAVALMAERGIDISDHIATSLGLRDINRSNLVLVMERSQVKRVEMAYPFAKGKVYRLGDAHNFDIADPYQRGRSAFEGALAQIERGVAAWVNALSRLK